MKPFIRLYQIACGYLPAAAWVNIRGFYSLDEVGGVDMFALSLLLLLGLISMGVILKDSSRDEGKEF